MRMYIWHIEYGRLFEMSLRGLVAKHLFPAVVVFTSYLFCTIDVKLK